jgi:RNA recognition motif-containing protein
MSGELIAEKMSLGDLNYDKDFMTRVHVRNTFLDYSVEDPWMVTGNSNLRRQQTDSILHCNSNARDELSRVTCEAFETFSKIPNLMNVGPVHPNALSGSEEEKDDEHSEEGTTTLSESVGQDVSQLNQEIRHLREIAVNGGGLNGCTTVMMKEVPLKYTQRNLLREINASGFTGKFDFLYLPMDPRSHANRGFAFINMVSERVAEEFYKKFHGQHLRHFNAEKPVVVLPADLQGFEENALQYASIAARQGPVGRRTGYTKPIFFRPLPPHIAAKLDQNKNSEPQVQRSTKPVASRPPERPIRQSQDKTRELADLLQQALFPAMLKANLPLIVAQAQQPPAAAKPPPRFCVYCGRTRLPDHSFCPYCGEGF